MHNGSSDRWGDLPVGRRCNFPWLAMTRLWLFENVQVGMYAKHSFPAPQNPPVITGLDPVTHLSSKGFPCARIKSGHDEALFHHRPADPEPVERTHGQIGLLFALQARQRFLIRTHRSQAHGEPGIEPSN